MAILKKDVKRLTIQISKTFLEEIDAHLDNYALTSRGQWILDAVREKLAKEKQLLSEIEEDEE
jgi:metal-responsive CopG/Arc/MetJ family transcriptional regulator